MCIGTVAYSLFSGQAVDYQSKQLEKSELYQRKLEILEEINKRSKLSDSVYHRIIEGIKFEPESKMKPDLEVLDENIIDLILKTIFHYKFMDLNLFKQEQDDDFNLELGKHIKKRTFDKGENLYYQDDPAASFFIIKRGEVGFMSKEFTEVPFLKVTNGFVGEYELCKGIPREFTVQALQITKVYIIEAEDFIRLLVNNKLQIEFCTKFELKAET